jgi:divalent metal cation (Fe/Co/Zn/Cd) transporter
VAIVLGIETKSLLVGEGASADDTVRIRDAINADSTVESLIHMKTLYLGPDELLVAAKVAFPTKMKLAEVAAAINSLESRVRAEVPIARVIYIEPDVYVTPGAGNPSTEAIIIRAAD